MTVNYEQLFSSFALGGSACPARRVARNGAPVGALAGWKMGIGSGDGCEWWKRCRLLPFDGSSQGQPVGPDPLRGLKEVRFPEKSVPSHSLVVPEQGRRCFGATRATLRW